MYGYRILTSWTFHCATSTLSEMQYMQSRFSFSNLSRCFRLQYCSRTFQHFEIRAGDYNSSFMFFPSMPYCLGGSYKANGKIYSLLFPSLPQMTVIGTRMYSSSDTSKADSLQATSASPSVISSSNTEGSDWADSLKHLYQSLTDTMSWATQKAKGVSDDFIPYVHQLLDTFPFLGKVIIPVIGTLTATILAWMVMPRLLRRLHEYSMLRNLTRDEVSYEKSLWAALEDPVRYLITFMSFSQLSVLVAPSTIASHYIGQAWRGALVLSFVWFLYRWKSNVLAWALTAQNIVGINRDQLMTLDKLTSAGLLVLGLMGTAEACGVAVQSILTVGGIGGIATAFAARDILGNMLSGLSLQFSRPFLVGDTIKAGHVEGLVLEMGLTATSLLNNDKFPVIVPNSFFLNQAIVNKTRAEWHSVMTKIPLHITAFDKIPKVSEDIKSMLRVNPKVFLGREAPYCFLSRIESSFMELTIGCNLQHMNKDDLYSAEQDILLQSAQIINKHGFEIGSTLQF